MMRQWTPIADRRHRRAPQRRSRARARRVSRQRSRMVGDPEGAARQRRRASARVVLRRARAAGIPLGPARLAPRRPRGTALRRARPRRRRQPPRLARGPRSGAAELDARRLRARGALPRRVQRRLPRRASRPAVRLAQPRLPAQVARRYERGHGAARASTATTRSSAASTRRTWPRAWPRCGTSRERLLDALGRLPQTLCHHDAFRRDLVAHGDRIVALDWAFVGRGPVGAEISPLVSATLTFREVGSEQRAGARACRARVVHGRAARGRLGRAGGTCPVRVRRDVGAELRPGNRPDRAPGAARSARSTTAWPSSSASRSRRCSTTGRA